MTTSRSNAVHETDPARALAALINAVADVLDTTENKSGRTFLREIEREYYTHIVDEPYVLFAQ